MVLENLFLKPEEFKVWFFWAIAGQEKSY
jgi:hypothetical protein